MHQRQQKRLKSNMHSRVVSLLPPNRLPTMLYAKGDHELTDELLIKLMDGILEPHRFCSGIVVYLFSAYNANKIMRWLNMRSAVPLR